MSFRKKFSIGALTFLLTVPLALLIFPEKPEPNWEGRKLSEWVQVAGPNTCRQHSLGSPPG